MTRALVVLLLALAACGGQVTEAADAGPEAGCRFVETGSQAAFDYDIICDDGATP